jgi:hypothetical protein
LPLHLLPITSNDLRDNQIVTAKPSPSIPSQRAVIASPGAFDGLRLVAALAVLFTHSYALLGRGQLELLTRFTNGSTDFSELGLLPSSQSAAISSRKAGSAIRQFGGSSCGGRCASFRA